MMFVFTGPTLPPHQARQHLDAVYLSPVSQGDIYRVALHRPQAIGIIDGYFDQVPAVWHKEILWALGQGIPVYGSSSMGALRASELAQFGMIGVGRIFEAFLRGDLEDDDEVAIQHGPSETGYLQLSDAMVNIRATLMAARDSGVIGEEIHGSLERVAKDLYYADRNYETLDRIARERGLAKSELDALTAWLPKGRIDQKRADAIAMLDAMQESAANGATGLPSDFHFEHTTLWDELCRSAGHLAVGCEESADMIPQDAILDELRLSAGSVSHVRMLALARRLAAAEIRRHQIDVGDEELYQTLVEFRQQRGLLEAADLERWLKDNHLSQRGLFELIRKEAGLREVMQLVSSDIAAEMVECARIDGSYPDLARRGLAKQPIFANIDADTHSSELYDQALTWFFDQRNEPRRPLPKMAQELGFADADDLRRAVLGEYLYRRGRSPA